MKKFKKIMAVLVAAIMVVAMTVPAWAGTGDGEFSTQKGTIIIEKARKNEDYYAYKILTLASVYDNKNDEDYHSTDHYSYVIKSDSPWVNFFVAGKITGSGYPLQHEGDGAAYIDLDIANPITLNDGTNDGTYYIATGKGALLNPWGDLAAGGSKDETTAGEWLLSANVQEFAQKALAFAKDNVAVTYANATTRLANNATDETNLTLGTTFELGYYLIDSTMGTLCSLDTTNLSVTVRDKNSLPTSDKFVKEDRTLSSGQQTDLYTGYGDVNDATIGQKVFYRSIIGVKKGAAKFVYADKMDPGLTLTDGSVKVYFVKNPATTNVNTYSATTWTELKKDATVTIGTGTTANYEDAHEGADFFTYYPKGDAHLVANFGSAGDSTFEIAFNQNFLDWLNDKVGDTNSDFALVVTYTATLNDDAVIAGDGNVNRSKLVYGDNQQSATPEEKTTTFTWPVDIFKHTMQPASDTPVAGAVFSLSNKVDSAESLADDGVTTVAGYYCFEELSDADAQWDDAFETAHTGCAQYKVVPYTAGGTKTIETNSSGYFRIAGLDAGDYYLHEISAPNGYNKLTHPYKITIGSTLSSTDGGATQTGSETIEYAVYKADASGYDTAVDVTSTGVVPVVNTSSTELPSTGGMGTTVLYIVGGMLVILAGAYLFFSRKRTA